MKPSPLRSSAMRIFSFEAGMSTFSCSARLAFRIRVSMSAIGSVMDIGSLLPARLDDAGDFAPEGQLPKTQPAQLELAEVAARPAAQLAAVVGPRPELGRALRLEDERSEEHTSELQSLAYLVCR